MENKQPEFLNKLFTSVLGGCFQFQTDNIDVERFPEEAQNASGRKIKDKFLSAAAGKGFTRRRFNLDNASRALSLIARQAAQYQELYDSLGDRSSQDLLVKLLQYRVLGPEHVRLPLNTPRYQELRQTVDARYLRNRATRKAAGWTLNRYQMENGIQLDLHAVGLCTTFLIEHYAYHGGETIAAGPGDIVIDGGGCWGDTALYFADKVSSTGRVCCYEFDAANLEILQANLQLNPSLAPRVQIVRHALWNKSGETIHYSPHGPSTTLDASTDRKEASATTLSIDDLVAQQKLPRVDFIKMDIEGAEMAALAGAEQTLRRFRPRLAISLYHKPDDLFEIPAYVKNLNLGYRLFLGHYTIHQEETVLFATAAEAPRK